MRRNCVGDPELDPVAAGAANVGLGVLVASAESRHATISQVIRAPLEAPLPGDPPQVRVAQQVGELVHPADDS